MNSVRTLMITVHHDRTPVALCAVDVNQADTLLKLLEQPRTHMIASANKLGLAIVDEQKKYRMLGGFPKESCFSVLYYVKDTDIIARAPITIPLRVAMVYASAVRVAVLQDTDSGLDNLRSDLRRFIMGLTTDTNCCPFLPTIGILPKTR